MTTIDSQYTPVRYLATDGSGRAIVYLTEMPQPLSVLFSQDGTSFITLYYQRVEGDPQNHTYCFWAPPENVILTSMKMVDGVIVSNDGKRDVKFEPAAMTAIIVEPLDCGEAHKLHPALNSA